GATVFNQANTGMFKGAIAATTQTATQGFSRGAIVFVCFSYRGMGNELREPLRGTQANHFGHALTRQDVVLNVGNNFLGLADQVGSGGTQNEVYGLLGYAHLGVPVQAYSAVRGIHGALQGLGTGILDSGGPIHTHTLHF